MAVIKGEHIIGRRKEMSETEGAIEKHDDAPKEMRPNKDGSKSFKYGVQVGGNWYGVFGSEAEIRSIESDILNIESTEEEAQAKITWDFDKSGKYRNIQEIVIDKGGKSSGKEPKKTAAELAQEKALKDTDPTKNLVKEEVLGVEEVEALVDKHYVDMMHRARRIINQAGAVKPCPWADDIEKAQFLVRIFDKLAGPEIYVRTDVEKYPAGTHKKMVK